MATGTVKWFNNAKGYGFILPEGGGEDLFAHYSSIQMEGYKTLKAGQAVHYETLEGPKGYHAVNIRVAELGDEAPAEPRPPTVEFEDGFGADGQADGADGTDAADGDSDLPFRRVN